MRLWIDFLLQIAMFLLSSELTVPWFQLILSYRKKKKFFLTYPSPVSVYQLLPMKDMLLFGQFTITITIVLVAQLCPTLCNPMDCSLARLLCPWDSWGQEYWSELPFPCPRELPDLRTEPGSSALQADSLPSEPPGRSNINN